MRALTDCQRRSTGVGGPRRGAAGARSWRSRTRRLQIPQPDHVIRRRGEGQLPIDELDTAMPQLPQATDGLHPPKDLFHELSFPLTDVIARMPRGPAVDRTPASLLRHVGRDLQHADVVHKARHVVALVRPDRTAGGARWPPATARRPRVRPCPLRGSHRRWRRAHADCPAARGPDTPVLPPSRHPSDAASPPGRSSTGACRCAARAPWKLTVGFPGSSGGSLGAASRLRKLFRLAHASNWVPSTVKCSSESRPAARAWARTASKNAAATSPASRRSRFFVNVVGCQTGSSIFNPTNHRNSRL